MANSQKLWKELVDRFRRVEGIALSREELEEEAARISGETLSDEEIDAIVAAVSSGDTTRDPPTPDLSWLAELDTSAVEEGVLQLNRKKGEMRDSIKERLEELRKGRWTMATKETWKTTNARLRAAEQLAEDIVEYHDIIAPPVDPFAIAATEKPLLKVIAEDFDDAFDGQLEYHRDHNRFLLFLNTKYDVPLNGGHHERTRFSLGHEIGHYMLESHRAYLMGGGQPHGSSSEYCSDQLMEREADAFAAGLLMPRRLIRSEINKGELSFERVSEIATMFKTSMVSTAIRSVQLSDFPCTIVGIRGGAIAWMFVSEPLIDAGCYPAERGTLSSPTALQAWADFEAGSLSRCQTEGRIHSWFRTYDRDNVSDLYLGEDYFPVRAMDTLLVLLVVDEADLSGDED